MIIAGRHIRVVCRMFRGSVVKNFFLFKRGNINVYFVEINFIFLLGCSPDKSLSKNKFLTYIKANKV
jgi:hypothetical protein